jgi:hypothetical protein
MTQFEETTVEAVIEKIQRLEIPPGSTIRVVVQPHEEIDEKNQASARLNAFNELFGMWKDRQIDARELRKRAWARSF